jgi:restriction system protein
MPIPDFQSIMLPLLTEANDGQEHSTKDAYKSMASMFTLSEEELERYLPSGNQKVFYNRVFWAKAHLKMAGLVENTKRGHFKITQAGKDVLAKKPNRINITYLRQFPSYLEATNRPKEDSVDSQIMESGLDFFETPEENLDRSYLKIREVLEVELLSKVKSCSPSFFEKLVIDLLVRMGYGGSNEEAARLIGKPGDEGIDGIIKEDRLGLDTIYVQAKKWDTTVVGRPEIQKFVGALAGQRAKKGVFITTSRFSDEARNYESKNEFKIVLIDGPQLTQYMIDFNLGVNVHQTYEIKRIDSDYFEED